MLYRESRKGCCFERLLCGQSFQGKGTFSESCEFASFPARRERDSGLGFRAFVTLNPKP